MTANQIAYWTLGEGRRHNEVTEAETTRHNQAQEAIQRSQVALGYAQLAEQERANDMNFIVNKAKQLTDQMRAETSEKSRQDTATYQTLVIEETARHNVAMEEENARHNKQTELISSNTNFLRGQELELEKLKLQKDLAFDSINTVKEAILGKKGLLDYLAAFAN